MKKYVSIILTVAFVCFLFVLQGSYLQAPFENGVEPPEEKIINGLESGVCTTNTAFSFVKFLL